MARKPQKKSAGSQVIFTLDDNQVVLDYINGQSNISEGIRFAIEYFVQQQGSFDIQSRVPMRRDISNPAQYLGGHEQAKVYRHNVEQTIEPSLQSNVEDEQLIIDKEREEIEELTLPVRNTVEDSNKYEFEETNEDQEEEEQVVIGNRRYVEETPKKASESNDKEQQIDDRRSETKKKDDLGSASWLLD